MIIKGKAALHIARQQLGLIQIHQGILSGFDIPTRINLGKYDFDLRPALYYYVQVVNGKHRGKFYYVLFGVYHYADYSDCWFAETFKLLHGEHRHDFEAFLLRIPYYNPHGKPRQPLDVITVAHHELKYYRNDINMGDGLSILIQERSHAIHAADKFDDEHTKLHNPMLFTDIRLFSYLNIRHIGIVRRAFKKSKVNLADGFSHNGKYTGWMLTNPCKLFEIMEDK